MTARILDGEVVLVTGGTSGIGRSCAIMMAGAGARVAIAGLKLQDSNKVAAEIAENGGVGLGLEIDVRSPQSVRAGIDRIVATWGRLDAVFNSAGILRQASVMRSSAEDWDDVVAVHAGGHANVLEASIEVMKRQGRGRLITVSSGAAIDGIGELAAYTTAKTAILGMTRSLAASLAGDGISINAISPTAYTPMSRDVPPGDDSIIPARYRRRSPDEVASFVTFLASDLAKGVTGRLFMVSGGHVIEFDAPRPLKLMQLPLDADRAEVVEELAWIGRRPTADTIGRRPTRDYFFLGPNGAVVPEPPSPAERQLGRVAIAGLPKRLAGLESRLAALGSAPTSLDQLTGEISGGIVFTPENSISTDSVAAAWSAAAPLIRQAFLSVQTLAVALEARGKGAIIVVLPAYSSDLRGLFLEVLSAGLIGLARSAASGLAKSNIAVYAVHEPSGAEDIDGFALLAAALLAGGAQSGGLFAVGNGHMASFVFEMPAWQHFSAANLDDRWLESISSAVSTRGRDWPRPSE